MWSRGEALATTYVPVEPAAPCCVVEGDAQIATLCGAPVRLPKRSDRVRQAGAYTRARFTRPSNAGGEGGREGGCCRQAQATDAGVLPTCGLVCVRMRVRERVSASAPAPERYLHETPVFIMVLGIPYVKSRCGITVPQLLCGKSGFTRRIRLALAICLPLRQSPRFLYQGSPSSWKESSAIVLFPCVYYRVHIVLYHHALCSPE